MTGGSKVEKALAAFAKWAIDQVNQGYDLDTDDVYQKAIELNLVIVTAYDSEVHGDEIDAKPGEDIYILSDEVRAML